MSEVLHISDVVQAYISGEWGEDSNIENSLIEVACVRGADINDVNGNAFNSIPIRYVSSSSLSKKGLKEGNIVIEKSGGAPEQSTGRVAYISRELIETHRDVVCSNFCEAFSVKQEWEPKYIFYYLQFFYNAGVFFNFEGKTSGIRNLDVELAFAAIPIIKIDINEQRRITDILSNIDKKIALNRSINSNLEALARQLYDYWFVQFDFPDADGNPYKSSGGKMLYDEKFKRDIPEGWEVKKLKSCIKHINTGLNPRKNFVFGGYIRYITVKNLTTEGVIDFSGCDYINEAARSKVHKRSKIEVGDILYASICPLGRTYLITSSPIDWDINESVFSLRPDTDLISSEYLNMLLKDEYYIRKLTQSSTGSIFQGIRIHELESTQILVPHIDIIKEYSKKVHPIMLQKAKLTEEIASLTRQRDELLPLLMNGQVTIE